MKSLHLLLKSCSSHLLLHVQWTEHQSGSQGKRSSPSSTTMDSLCYFEQMP